VAAELLVEYALGHSGDKIMLWGRWVPGDSFENCFGEECLGAILGVCTTPSIKMAR
jgi:hypothetical protein